MTDLNVDIYGKSPQKYKTNVYLTYTGLPQYPDGWAFMSAEDGYGIEIISPEAMLDDLTIAHEFGHVATMQQKAWSIRILRVLGGNVLPTGLGRCTWEVPIIRGMSRPAGSSRQPRTFCVI